MPTGKTMRGFLSNNALKIIAATLMVFDHIGMLLIPDSIFLRCIGRPAFPIFAYLVAEGAKYTKNFLRHFLTVAGFAAVIQIGYYLFTHSLEMSVMFTFTLSLIIIFALDLFKSAVFTKTSSKAKIIFSALFFLSTVILAAFLDLVLDIDYHFSGCIIPVLPSLLTTPKVDDPPEIFKKLDTKIYRIVAASLGIMFLSLDFGGLQFFGFLAIPILMLYSEQRGKLKMKYFFYIFYPLHLIILYGIVLLIK